MDAAVLNAAASPTVYIADGSITGAALDVDDVVDAIGDALLGVNFLPQGAFAYDLFRTPPAAVDCATTVLTWVARDWWVLATGATATAEASAITPTDRSDNSLKLNGATSLTELEAGTWVPPEVAGLLKNVAVKVTCYVYNSTGATISPELVIRTAATKGVPALSGAGVDYAADTTAANGAWTRLTFTLDTTLTNTSSWLKGVQMSVKISGANVPGSGEYVSISQMAMEAVAVSSVWLRPEPALPQVPAGTVFPYAGPTTKLPAGWLACDGTSYAATTYPRLFEAIGYAHGGSAGNFNVPDGRGRTFVGAEVSGSSQSRMEVSMSATGTSGQATLTVTSTAGLRLGMGAYGTNVATGAYIIGLTETVVTVSANHSGTVNSTVRFGKLGASADPETVGSAGNGMSYGRNEVKLTKMACSTATNTTLTVPGLDGLACGMTVSGTNIPAGTTIACFLTPTTVRLAFTSPATATTGTTSGLTMTFGVEAPEGNQWERYQYLLANPTILCRFSGAADQALQTGAASELINYLIAPGWAVTGEAGAAIVAGTYVSTVDTSGLTNFSLSAAAGNAGAANYELTFSGSSLSRTGTPTPDTLPAFTGNWIIKY